jgi:uncharacterized DUF497 family protein
MDVGEDGEALGLHPRQNAQVRAAVGGDAGFVERGFEDEAAHGSAGILKGGETCVRLEWNALKAAVNLRNHGVPFDEAASVFLDPLSATGDDPDHSLDERRFVTFGVSSSGRLLVDAHVQHDDSIRIITARLATRAERKIYEET